MDNCLSQKDKINHIKEYLDKDENGKFVDDIYLKYVNMKIKKEKKTKKNGIEKCKLDDPRYVVLLKFLNCVLTNIGSKNIKKIEEFKDIDREDIIRDVNKILLDGNMGDELYKYFDKAACGWYRRKQTETYILSFLRYSCKNIGYSFEYYQKDIVTQINNKNSRQTRMFYNIL